MGSSTTNYNLYKPAVGEVDWGGDVNTSTDTVDTTMKANEDAAALNTTHRSSNGTDHSYIDQDVTSGASPTFDAANISGVDASGVDIADAGGIITATEVEGALQENRTAINLNTAKDTNVSTALSTGTVTPTTYGITSDGGVDDVVLVEADTTNAGLLGSDKWDEIVANNAKITNVSTALSAGTINATTYGITSDGGANDIVLPEATTDYAGLLGADKWDEIVASTTHDGSSGSDHSLVNSSLVSTINFIIDGGGAAIDTGIKGDVEIPFACTINQVTLLADQAATAVIDIWGEDYANFPPTDADTITSATPPTITAALKAQDSTLTSWTTSITAGDILRFNVDSNDVAERITISIKVTKT